MTFRISFGIYTSKASRKYKLTENNNTYKLTENNNNQSSNCFCADFRFFLEQLIFYKIERVYREIKSFLDFIVLPDWITFFKLTCKTFLQNRYLKHGFFNFSQNKRFYGIKSRCKSFFNFSKLSDGGTAFHLSLLLSEIIKWLKFCIVSYVH